MMTVRHHIPDIPSIPHLSMERYLLNLGLHQLALMPHSKVGIQLLYAVQWGDSVWRHSKSMQPVHIIFLLCKIVVSVKLNYSNLCQNYTILVFLLYFTRFFFLFECLLSQTKQTIIKKNNTSLNITTNYNTNYNNIIKQEKGKLPVYPSKCLKYPISHQNNEISNFPIQK